MTSEFFLDVKRFLGKIAIKPDQEMRGAFFAADLRAQDLARPRLETDPDDANALFAMTLSLGMQADYAGLIEKHQLESLGMIREADKFAKKLLAVNPDAADAYLTCARPLPAAVCENSPGAGGVTREEDTTCPYSTYGARRGVSGESAFCE